MFLVKAYFQGGQGLIIKLTSNFDLSIQSIEMNEPSSLRSLLMELNSKVPGELNFIDPKTDDLDDFFVVSVNEQELPFLPEKLDTKLKDGDEVQVAIVSFGGGGGDILCCLGMLG